MTEQDRERLARNTGPHDDVIPGPTDDTYKSSDLADVDRADDPRADVVPNPGDAGEQSGTHPQRGWGKASQDELADDPGERRFDH